MSFPEAPVFEDLRRLCGPDRGPARTPDAARPLWIFGAGAFGRALCAALRDAGFEPAGFVETKPAAPTLLGLPVRRLDAFGSGAAAAQQLALGVFNRLHALDVLEALARSAGFKDIFMPWDLYARFGPALGWRFWLSGPQAIRAGLPDIERAYGCLADEASRTAFLRTLAFRLGQDTAFASFRHAEPQYFNELTLGALPPRVRYVDGGAFDGDTFLQLDGLRPVAEAWLFEPEADNYRALSAAVQGAGKAASCLPLGLDEDYRMLRFDAGGGDASAVSDRAQGGVSIAAAALDQVVPRGRRVDFIKLDVEGSEARALRGARRTIQDCRPVLALSLYHRPEDLWALPLQLLPLCPDYRFFVRQHYFNSFESVLYAVPKAAQGPPGGST